MEKILPGKIEVWECSDGVITKSEVIYKRREKALKKLAKAKKEGILNIVEMWKLDSELELAGRTDEEIALDKSRAKYYKWSKLPENICTTCDGSGKTWWTDVGYGTDRDYQETCKDCNGRGINEQARKKVDNGKKF